MHAANSVPKGTPVNDSERILGLKGGQEYTQCLIRNRRWDFSVRGKQGMSRQSSKTSTDNLRSIVHPTGQSIIHKPHTLLLSLCSSASSLQTFLLLPFTPRRDPPAISSSNTLFIHRHTYQDINMTPKSSPKTPQGPDGTANPDNAFMAMCLRNIDPESKKVRETR